MIGLDETESLNCHFLLFLYLLKLENVDLSVFYKNDFIVYSQ